MLKLPNNPQDVDGLQLRSSLEHRVLVLTGPVGAGKGLAQGLVDSLD